jgi:hypothetical protein
MKTNRKLIGLIACLCLILAACKVTSQNCADAVNKYANTLSAFQDAEIQMHDQKKVSDSTHLTILEAEKLASHAGRDMDAGILLASTGADPTKYIALAEKTYADLSTIVYADASANQGLSTLLSAAGAALKNAISLITALRSQTPSSAPAPAVAKPASYTSHNMPHQMPLWPFTILPLMGLAAIGGGLAAAAQLLQILMQLEPVAFDLVVKFATSLKGKSTAEILALNESLFDKIDSTIASEEAKLKNPSA